MTTPKAPAPMPVITRLLGDLIPALVHDLNNLLFVMSASLDFLETDPRNVRDAIAAMRAALSRTTTLTRFLLDSGSPSWGTPDTVELPDAVHQLMPLCERLAGPAVKVSCSVGVPPCVVRIGRCTLEHVLLNLVANARDAMPVGGRLTISVDLEPHGDAHRVVIDVTDTGVGMSPDLQARIFDRHFTTKPAGRGVGLGLDTARTVVEAAGGTICVRSRPDSGSSFRVALPAFLVEGTVNAECS